MNLVAADYIVRLENFKNTNLGAKGALGVLVFLDSFANHLDGYFLPSGLLYAVVHCREGTFSQFIFHEDKVLPDAFFGDWHWIDLQYFINLIVSTVLSTIYWLEYFDSSCTLLLSFYVILKSFAGLSYLILSAWFSVSFDYERYIGPKTYMLSSLMMLSESLNISWLLLLIELDDLSFECRELTRLSNCVYSTKGIGKNHLILTIFQPNNQRK